MSTAAVEPSVRHADASEPAAPAAHAPRTRLLLHGAILPTLLRLASPNVLVVLAQTATGLVAMVGTGIGAGHYDRALRVAFIGGAVAFAVTESIGVAAALQPRAWLGLFSTEPRLVETASLYLRAAGPFYGFFGLGLALYFASQGAGRPSWPLLAGFMRMLVALGGGWLALRLTGSLRWLFAAQALGFVLYGSIVLAAIRSGVWFRGRGIGGRRA